MATGRDRRMVAGILAGIGLPFAIAGSLVAVLVPPNLSRQAESAAELRLATAETLKERGVEVAVEGVIHDLTPVTFESFVAYVEYARVTRDGETEWEKHAIHNPPLWLSIPDGQVELTEGYSIRTTTTTHQANGRRYLGFTVGDRVFVMGHLAATATADQPARIDAHTVTAETQAEYVASLRSGVIVARWLGILFCVVGGDLILSGGVVFFWRA